MRRLLLLSFLVASSPCWAASPELLPPPPLVSGFAPRVQLTALPDGVPVRIWTVRRFTKWQEVEGKWTEVPVELFAWADY